MLIFTKYLKSPIEMKPNYETKQYRAIFPDCLNSNDCLNGGKALMWMDEIAYITASNYSGQNIYTYSIKNIKFSKLIEAESIVEIISRIEKVENFKIHITVEVYRQNKNSGKNEKAIWGNFVMIAMDNRRKPIPIKNNRSCNTTNLESV
jgi:acyl-CoA hydrolase